jgi:serine/threonine protein phosphatase PrpC
LVSTVIEYMGVPEMTIPYGLAETIGLRDEMEDGHAIWDDEETGIFSAEVYDGHGGWIAASLAADILTAFFLARQKEIWRERGHKELDADALRDAYLAADRYIVGRTESGSATATLYIYGGAFLAANVGDARIVVGEGRRAIDLTVDHKPDLPGERDRIEAQGGRVIAYDVARVQGVLAMSRSLGDGPLKPFVTAEPRVARGFFGRGDDVAVIACDGLWDVLTSEDAVRIARTASGPSDAAKLLEKAALDRGSTDNITVIVLDLRGYTASCKGDVLHVTGVLDCAQPGGACSAG